MASGPDGKEIPGSGETGEAKSKPEAKKALTGREKQHQDRLRQVRENLEFLRSQADSVLFASDVSEVDAILELTNDGLAALEDSSRSYEHTHFEVENKLFTLLTQSLTKRADLLEAYRANLEARYTKGRKPTDLETDRDFQRLQSLKTTIDSLRERVKPDGNDYKSLMKALRNGATSVPRIQAELIDVEGALGFNPNLDLTWQERLGAAEQQRARAEAAKAPERQAEQRKEELRQVIVETRGLINILTAGSSYLGPSASDLDRLRQQLTDAEAELAKSKVDVARVDRGITNLRANSRIKTAIRTAANNLNAAINKIKLDANAQKLPDGTPDPAFTDFATIDSKIAEDSAGLAEELESLSDFTGTRLLPLGERMMLLEQRVYVKSTVETLRKWDEKHFGLAAFAEPAELDTINDQLTRAEKALQELIDGFTTTDATARLMGEIKKERSVTLGLILQRKVGHLQQQTDQRLAGSMTLIARGRAKLLKGALGKLHQQTPAYVTRLATEQLAGEISKIEAELKGLGVETEQGAPQPSPAPGGPGGPTPPGNEPPGPGGPENEDERRERELKERAQRLYDRIRTTLRDSDRFIGQLPLFYGDLDYAETGTLEIAEGRSTQDITVREAVLDAVLNRLKEAQELRINASLRAIEGYRHELEDKLRAKGLAETGTALEAIIRMAGTIIDQRDNKLPQALAADTQEALYDREIAPLAATLRSITARENITISADIGPEPAPKAPEAEPGVERAKERVTALHQLVERILSHRLLPDRQRGNLEGIRDDLRQFRDRLNTEGNAALRDVEFALDQGMENQLVLGMAGLVNGLEEARNNAERDYRNQRKSPSYRLLGALKRRISGLGNELERAMAESDTNTEKLTRATTTFERPVRGIHDTASELERILEALEAAGPTEQQQERQERRSFLQNLWPFGRRNRDAENNFDRETRRRRQERARNPERRRRATRLDQEAVLDKMAETYRHQGDENERIRKGRMNKAELLEELKGKDGEFEKLRQTAIAEHILEVELGDALDAAHDREEALKKKNVGGKILAFLGTTVAGTFARQLLQQYAIQLGWGGNLATHAGTIAGGKAAGATAVIAANQAALDSARWLSLGSGALVGGIIGAGSGLYRGAKRARQELYDANRIMEEIRTYGETPEEQLTPQQQVELLEKLLLDNKLHGKEGEVLAVYDEIKRIRNAEIKRELDERIKAIKEADPDAYEAMTEEERLAKVASAMTELYEHRAREGSEARRGNSIQEFIDSKESEVGKRKWKAMWKGAGIGAVVGGGFGFLFPAAGLVVQLKAQLLAKTKAIGLASITEMPQMIKDSAETIKNWGLAHHLSPEQIAAKTAEVKANWLASLPTDEIRHMNLNVHDMIDALKSGHYNLAERIAGANMGVTFDYNHDGQLPITVGEMCKQFVQTAKTNGMSDDNITRGVYHIMSHADAIGGHFQEFMQIATAHGHDGGREFTLNIIHGGSGTFNPFPVHPGNRGGLAEAMAGSMYDYVHQGFTHTPGHPTTPLKLNWLGPETPWAFGDALIPMGAMLTSFQSRPDSPWYKAADWWNGIWDGRRASKREKNAPAGEKSGETNEEENKVDGASTGKLAPIPRKTFDRDERRKDENRDLRTRMADLRKEVMSRHGYFVFKPQADGTLKAYRIWSYDTQDARLWQKISGHVHKPERLNAFEQDRRARISELDGGKIWVKEFNLGRLATPIRDEKGLKNTWQPTDWEKPPHKKVSVDDVFEFSGPDSAATPLVIHPTEVQKYAWLYANGHATPGEKIDNLNDFYNEKRSPRKLEKREDLTHGMFLKDPDTDEVYRVIDDPADPEPDATKKRKIMHKYDASSDTFETSFANVDPGLIDKKPQIVSDPRRNKSNPIEGPRTLKNIGDKVESEADLQPGMVIDNGGQIIRLDRKEADGKWRYSIYQPGTNDYHSGYIYESDKLDELIAAKPEIIPDPQSKGPETLPMTTDPRGLAPESFIAIGTGIGGFGLQENDILRGTAHPDHFYLVVNKNDGGREYMLLELQGNEWRDPRHVAYDAMDNGAWQVHVPELVTGLTSAEFQLLENEQTRIGSLIESGVITEANFKDMDPSYKAATGDILRYKPAGPVQQVTHEHGGYVYVAAYDTTTKAWNRSRSLRYATNNIHTVAEILDESTLPSGSIPPRAPKAPAGSTGPKGPEFAEAADVEAQYPSADFKIIDQTKRNELKGNTILKTTRPITITNAAGTTLDLPYHTVLRIEPTFGTSPAGTFTELSVLTKTGWEKLSDMSLDMAPNDWPEKCRVYSPDSAPHAAEKAPIRLPELAETSKVDTDFPAADFKNVDPTKLDLLKEGDILKATKELPILADTNPGDNIPAGALIRLGGQATRRGTSVDQRVSHWFSVYDKSGSWVEIPGARVLIASEANMPVQIRSTVAEPAPAAKEEEKAPEPSKTLLTMSFDDPASPGEKLSLDELSLTDLEAAKKHLEKRLKDITEAIAAGGIAATTPDVIQADIDTVDAWIEKKTKGPEFADKALVESRYPDSDFKNIDSAKVDALTSGAILKFTAPLALDSGSKTFNIPEGGVVAITGAISGGGKRRLIFEYLDETGGWTKLPTDSGGMAEFTIDANDDLTRVAQVRSTDTEPNDAAVAEKKVKSAAEIKAEVNQIVNIENDQRLFVKTHPSELAENDMIRTVDAAGNLTGQLYRVTEPPFQTVDNKWLVPVSRFNPDTAEWDPQQSLYDTDLNRVERRIHEDEKTTALQDMEAAYPLASFEPMGSRNVRELPAGTMLYAPAIKAYFRLRQHNVDTDKALIDVLYTDGARAGRWLPRFHEPYNSLDTTLVHSESEASAKLADPESPDFLYPDPTVIERARFKKLESIDEIVPGSLVLGSTDIAQSNPTDRYWTVMSKVPGSSARWPYAANSWKSDTSSWEKGAIWQLDTDNKYILLPEAPSPEPAPGSTEAYPDTKFEAFTNFEEIKRMVDAGKEVVLQTTLPPIKRLKVTEPRGKNWKTKEIDAEGKELKNGQTIAQTNVENGAYKIFNPDL